MCSCVLFLEAARTTAILNFPLAAAIDMPGSSSQRKPQEETRQEVLDTPIKPRRRSGPRSTTSVYLGVTKVRRVCAAQNGATAHRQLMPVQLSTLLARILTQQVVVHCSTSALEGEKIVS